MLEGNMFAVNGMDGPGGAVADGQIPDADILCILQKDTAAAQGGGLSCGKGDGTSSPAS